MNTATAADWVICADCHVPALTSVRMCAGPLVEVCPYCALARMQRFAPDLVADALEDLGTATQKLTPRLMVEVQRGVLRAEVSGPQGPTIQRVTVLPAEGRDIGPLCFWWYHKSEYTQGLVLLEAVPIAAVPEMSRWLRVRLTGR